MFAWLYLFIASSFEIGWIYSLKYMDVSKLKGVAWKNLLSDSGIAFSLFPFLGYVVFGLGNIWFFSLAMKQIPASTAFAVWMAVALAGVKMIDVIWFKENISSFQVISFILVIIGIIGLKKT